MAEKERKDQVEMDERMAEFERFSKDPLTPFILGLIEELSFLRERVQKLEAASRDSRL